MMELYNTLSRVASYPDVSMTQLGSMKFKIEMSGELMKSFMRFGEIQEEINNELSPDLEMVTQLGDGQDAIIEFRKKE